MQSPDGLEVLAFQSAAGMRVDTWKVFKVVGNTLIEEHLVIRLYRGATAGIIAGFMLAAAAYAGTADEIQHLLDYISGSGCTFVRNGVESDAAAARDHIQAKYAHAKRQVDSAEDFIRLVDLEAA